MERFPQQQTSQTHVFRLSSGLCASPHRLVQITPAAWEQIVQHALPLQPANAVVRLLVLKGKKQAVCESIDALQLETDNFGFLLNWDATSTDSFPALTTPQSSDTVIDSRQRFLRRYLSHRHSWQPPTSLLAEALVLAGYGHVIAP